MRLSGITIESIVDGPGLRIVLFAQGCEHKCPHCQNPETWDIDGGKEFTVKQIVKIIRKNKKNKQGVTFSGGEPFLQAADFAQIASLIRQMDLDIVTYTGFTFEQLIENKNEDTHALLKESDLLIDGKYIHEQRDIGLQFRGSKNQRVIDTAASLREEEIILKQF